MGNANACVAGARIVAMRELVEQRHGRAVLDRALRTLPAEVRDEYLNATAVSWVRATTDYSVHDAVAAALGQPAQAFHLALLREGLARSFKTLWKVLLRLTTDNALIARTPTIYKRTRNTGEMQSRLLAPGHAVLELRQYPGITARDGAALAAGLEVVFSLTGRNNARSNVVMVEDGANFEMLWDT